MLKVLICMLAIFSTLPAQAFDRLVCDSNLGNWSVHNSLDKKKVAMNKALPSTRFEKKESLMLLIRDHKGEEIVFFSPWNSIQMHKAKGLKQKNYQFDFKTDKETWFSLTVKDKKQKTSHSLACKLSF